MAWNEPGGNGKDPWGHRNNDQGPPDLEEIARKMQEKLGGLFGGGGGSGDDGPGTGQSLTPRALGFIVIGLLILWSLFGFYTVQPAEKGVELMFGKFNRVTEQGLHWHVPYPVETVVKVNVEEVRAVKHKATMLTQDENIVNVELVVQYKVKDAEDYLFNVRDPDDTLRQATESALREIVGTSKMDDVLTSGRNVAAADTKTLLQEILDRYLAGLDVRSVNMQNAQPPEAVQAAFADVIKAREDEERLKNTAEAYANEMVQKAGGMADRLRQEAEAYKAQVVARAEGETRRFLSVWREYAKAPEITRERLYLETMESVLSRSSKLLLDTNREGTPPLLYLPLDKLMGATSDTVGDKTRRDNEKDMTAAERALENMDRDMLRPARSDSRSNARSTR